MQDEVPTVMQNFKFYIMKCSTLHRPFMAEKSFHIEARAQAVGSKISNRVGKKIAN